MSALGALAAALLAGALATLVPRLIASVPEPAEPAEDKTPYAEIAAGRGLVWRAVVTCAVIGGVVGAVIGLDEPLLFLVPLIPVGFALALVDWRTRLLPTRIIAPTYAVLVPLVVVAAVASGEPALALRAAIGWAAMGGFYLLLWLVYPAGMGYGDVRLSGILGIVLGYLGVGSLALGAWSAFLLGGVGGIVLAAAKLVDRRNNPFGPWMLIGALIGIVFGPAFGDWMWGSTGG
ncbi:prepilin peptidase [Nocardioides piscis]|uniref:Prepilin peptidase n=1 Tax=Nocardioides piscis TaxID=2714938 RepID=A0A6G7YJ27_9ACTN|nr:A24 family peptidase [Nocardioides piscis]QIK76740.1 prepilin peptidase [Nocardioides piscis]